MSTAPSQALLLYVEDETLIRTDVADSLGEAGFSVVTAADGVEALSVLESQASSLRGLVTDIDLGDGPDGWEIARRARELKPEIAVIYVSGHGGLDWSARGVPHSVMVAKPFVAAQIVVAVSNLLNALDSSLVQPGATQ